MTETPNPPADGTAPIPCQHRWELIRFTQFAEDRRRPAERWRDDRCAICGETRRVLEPPRAADGPVGAK